MRFVVSFVSVLCLALACPTFASADRAHAARLFEEAERLGRAGEHARAAGLYEAAYALVPANVALVAAANERMLADDWDALTAHLEILERSRGERSVDAFLREMEAALLGVRTLLVVRCERACSLAADRHAPSAAGLEHRLWLVPAQSTSLWVRFEGGAIVARELSLSPGRREITIAHVPTTPLPPADDVPEARGTEERPASHEARAARRSRTRHALVVVTVGTLALDGVAVWALATASHDRRTYAEAPTVQRFERAVAAQRRATGIGTSALAVTTASTLVLVLVRARGRVTPSPVVDIARGAAFVGLAGSF